MLALGIVLIVIDVHVNSFDLLADGVGAVALLLAADRLAPIHPDFRRDRRTAALVCDFDVS